MEEKDDDDDDKSYKKRIKKRIKAIRIAYIVWRDRELYYASHWRIQANFLYDWIFLCLCIYLTSYEDVIYGFIKFSSELLSVFVPETAKGFSIKWFNRGVNFRSYQTFFDYRQDRVSLRIGLQYMPIGITCFYFFLTRSFIHYMVFMYRENFSRELLGLFFKELKMDRRFIALCDFIKNNPQDLDLNVDFLLLNYENRDPYGQLSMIDEKVLDTLNYIFNMKPEPGVRTEYYIHSAVNPGAGIYFGLINVAVLSIIVFLSIKYTVWLIFGLYGWTFCYYYSMGEILLWCSTDADFIKKQQAQHFYVNEAILNEFRLSETERAQLVSEHADQFAELDVDYSKPLMLNPENPAFQAWRDSWVTRPIQQLVVWLFNTFISLIKNFGLIVQSFLFKKLQPAMIKKNRFVIISLYKKFAFLIPAKFDYLVTAEIVYFNNQTNFFFRKIANSFSTFEQFYLNFNITRILIGIDAFVKGLFFILALRETSEGLREDPEIREAALDRQYEHTRMELGMDFTDEENEEYEVVEEEPDEHKADFQPLFFANFYSSIAAYLVTLLFIFEGVDHFIDPVTFIHVDDWDPIGAWLFQTWWTDFFRGDWQLYQTWYYSIDSWYKIPLYLLEDQEYDFDYEEERHNKYHNDYSDYMTEDYDWWFPDEADFELRDCYHDLDFLNWERREIWDPRVAEYMQDYEDIIWEIKHRIINFRSSIELEIYEVFFYLRDLIYTPLIKPLITPFLNVLQPLFDIIMIKLQPVLDYLQPVFAFIEKCLRKILVNGDVFFGKKSK